MQDPGRGLLLSPHPNQPEAAVASWMIPIPATAPEDLPGVAAQAHTIIDAQLADEDSDTIARAHAHLNAALGVAVQLINDGVFGDGHLSGTLSGHLPTSGSPYTTLSAQLSCAPVEDAP